MRACGGDLGGPRRPATPTATSTDAARPRRRPPGRPELHPPPRLADARRRRRATTTASPTAPSGRCATRSYHAADASTRPTGSSTGEVNQKFADAVLEEAAGGPALVFVQDYHFALLPRLLKDGPAGPGGGRSSGTSPGPTRRRSASARGQDELARRHARQRPARLPHPVPLQQLPGHRGPGARVAGSTGSGSPSPAAGTTRRVRPFPISVDPDLADRVPRRTAGSGRAAAVRKQLPAAATGRCSSAWTGSTTRRASRSGCGPSTGCSTLHPELKGTVPLRAGRGARAGPTSRPTAT